jgi:FAD/FMN-containing dehydrogenase
MASWENWAETVEHSDLAKVYEPRDVNELKAAVNEAAANGWKIRAVGTGHAWSNLGLPPGQQGAVILTDHLDGFTILQQPTATTAGLVEVEGGIKIAALTQTLFDNGLGLPNMGDANPQALAGALGTDTHGSGIGANLGSFSEQVEGMTLITADGQERVLNDEELKAGRVALGKLGVVYKVKLKVMPSYFLHHTRIMVRFRDEKDLLDNLLDDNRHVEYWFYPYTEMAERIVRNVANTTEEKNPLDFFERFLIRFASSVTNLRGKNRPETLPEFFRDNIDRLQPIERVGPWHEMLVGSSNIWREVVKTYTMEYQFAYDQLWQAFDDLEASIELAARKNVFVAAPIQFRFTKKSERSYLSHLTHEPTVSFSVSFHTNHVGAHTFLPELEQRFLALGGKPHWGKMYYVRPDIDPRFEAVRAALDPHGVFAFEQPLYTPDPQAFQDP